MKRFASVLIPAVLLFCSIAFAQGPQIQQFSADMTIKTASSGTMNGKYYMGDHKMRMDMTTQMGDMANIINLQTHKGYMLMEARHMYMEHDLNQAQPSRGPMSHGPSFEPFCDPDRFTCKQEGVETVNGRVCEKWVYTAKDSRNKDANQTMYIDAKIHAPVRIVQGNGTQVDFTNIKEGTQPDSLFQVPAGYQQFNPMGMMGGMGGRSPHN